LFFLQVLAPSAALALGTVGVAALLARGALVPRVVLAALVFAAACWCAQNKAMSTLLLAHGHNLVALALWVAYARQRKAHVIPALLAFAACAFLILHGELQQWLLHDEALAPSGLSLGVHRLAFGLSPSPAPHIVLRSLLFFAFAQSVHYAVWTRLIPEEDRAREGLRSCRATCRALVRDLGAPVLLAFIALTLWFVALAMLDLDGARAQYFRLALFHGPLELCAGAIMLLERRPPSREVTGV